jgi:hypothetical protein
LVSSHQEQKSALGVRNFPLFLSVLGQYFWAGFLAEWPPSSAAFQRQHDDSNAPGAPGISSISA